MLWCEYILSLEQWKEPHITLPLPSYSSLQPIITRQNSEKQIWFISLQLNSSQWFPSSFSKKTKPVWHDIQCTVLTANLSLTSSPAPVVSSLSLWSRERLSGLSGSLLCFITIPCLWHRNAETSPLFNLICFRVESKTASDVKPSLLPGRIRSIFSHEPATFQKHSIFTIAIAKKSWLLTSTSISTLDIILFEGSLHGFSHIWSTHSSMWHTDTQWIMFEWMVIQMERIFASSCLQGHSED